MKNKDWREVELEQVLNYEQPQDYIVENTDYQDEYKIPVLTVGKSYILGYTNETTGVYDKLPVIIFDDFTTDSRFIDFKFKVKSSAMKMLTAKNGSINLKYVFLMMQGIKRNSASHKRFYLSIYQKKKIPLPFKDGKPDLEEQERIVNILENTKNLKESGRKADKLFDEYLKSVFNEMFLKNRNNFEIKSIGEICETTSGGTPSRSRKEYWENGSVPWVKSGELDRGYIFLAEENITELGLRNSSAKYFEPDTVLIAMYGATVGKTALLKIKATTNQAICGLIPKNKKNLNPVYLLNIMSSLKERLISESIGGGQPNISQQIIRRTKIPLPPMPLQEKFASIVEKVEKIKEKQIRENRNVNELFDSLMQKAFRGELNIADEENKKEEGKE